MAALKGLKVIKMFILYKNKTFFMVGGRKVKSLHEEGISRRPFVRLPKTFLACLQNEIFFLIFLILKVFSLAYILVKKML